MASGGRWPSGSPPSAPTWSSRAESGPGRACRRGDPAAERPRGVIRADLASLASVRSAAEEIARRHSRIGLLINNAEIITRRREVTGDGLERQLAVNHLAPFLITLGLLDALRAGAPARIVNVSSGAHAGQRLEFDDLMSERDYRRDRVYGRTKLANILFTHGSPAGSRGAE